MFDSDLARLYGVTTANLNKAVKRRQILALAGETPKVDGLGFGAMPPVPTKTLSAINRLFVLETGL